MLFKVLLAEDAARDLEEIYDYIAEHDAPARADYVLKRFEKVVDGLADSRREVRIQKNCSRWESASTESVFQALSRDLSDIRSDGLRLSHRRRET